jgi:hypothetical protein
MPPARNRTGFDQTSFVLYLSGEKMRTAPQYAFRVSRSTSVSSENESDVREFKAQEGTRRGRPERFPGKPETI